MTVGNFNQKIFNPQAFAIYVENVPNLTRTELLKSRAVVNDSRLNTLFSTQTGSFYAVEPFYGNIGGNALNYDGQTDITSQRVDTYAQGIIVVGRANAWLEDDFAYDITGGVDFMSNVGNQVSRYFSEVDQQTLISILTGIFKMTGTGNADFVSNHTYDISVESGENAKVGATTLNTAVNKACGDNRNAFSLVIMHSDVATNLENLNLLNYLKYTDENGVQRDLSMGTWNGKTVLIDNSLPTGTSGSDTVYTTYVLGEGAFRYADIGAYVPYEMSRDPKTNGGQTTLYARQRKCFVPYGISYKKASQASLSPTNAELENGANWGLVANAGGNSFIDHRAIPIARIVSKG